MNLFKQQKFSIRKFNVGIFSALIATIAFLGVNPNSADADEQDNVNVGSQMTENAVNQGQPTDQPTPNENQAGIVDHTTDQVSPQNTASQEQNQQQNDNQNAVETNNAPITNHEATEVNNEATQTNAVTDNPVNEENQEQVQPQANQEKAQETPKEKQDKEAPVETNEGLNKQNKPVATVENNQTPKKRNKRDVGDDQNGNNVAPNQNQPANTQDEALENAKQGATNEINQKATDKNQAIENTTEATQEEKQLALNDVAHQQFNANNNINQANTTDDLTTAKNNGIAAIDAVNVQARTRDAARNAVVQKVADQILTINNNPDATDEEKQEAVNQVHQTEQQALKDINAANTENEINGIQTQNVNTIGNVVPASLAKPNAIAEVNQTAANHNDEIDANQNATNEEKAVAKEQVDGLAKNTTTNINDATNNQDVTQAKELGINQINAVTPATTVKDDAKNELNQSAEQIRNNNTNNYLDATTEEINAANNQVDQIVNQGNTAIGAANTTNEVNEARDHGIQELQNVAPDVVKKPAARNEINQAFEQKKQAINDSNQSTTEEKNDAINVLIPRKNEADNNIDQALTNDEVSNAVTNGINQINDVTPSTDKKQQAKSTIAQDAENKKQLINQDTNSTIEEHNVANANVDAAVTKANNDIDQAASNADVDNAVTTNQTDINQIQQEAQVKPAAKAEIAQKVTDQEGVIQNTRGTTTEEQNEALQALQNAKTQADQAIDAAQSNADVENVKNEQIAKIEAITPSKDYKNNAIAELENVANQRKHDLTQDPDMTKEEHDYAIDSVDRMLGQGSANVYQAANKQSVDNNKNDGINTINQVQAFVTTKANARNEITQAADQRKATFPNDNNATTEEKEEASNNVDAIVAASNEQINQAKTDAAVNQIKEQTIQEINQVTPANTKKETALANIKTKQDQQTYIINNEPNATTEEKEAALQALTQAVTTANNEINGATTNAQVETAVQNGETNISNVTPQTQTKTNAKNEVDQAAANQNNAIDQNQDATTEEKDAAKQLVARTQNNANQAIVNAENAADVETKKNEGINSIGQINADTAIKTAVKADLQNQANDKKQEIANNNGSTEEEKQAANSKVDDALQQGLTAVTNAQSIVDVNSAVKSTDQAIQSVQPETAIKDNAKQAIQNSINQQKEAVNQNPEATNEEKQLASNKLDDIANQVTGNIEQANTSNDVNQAKNEGTTQINQFVPSIVKKSNATQELDNAADLKQEELDKTPNATQDDIAEAKQAVQKALTTAKEQVTQSQTDQDVDNAKANGVSEIKAIQPIGTLRQAALEEFTDVYNDKVSEIEADIDGTREEVKAAITDLEAIKTQAEASINQAINVARLTAAKEHAIENVNQFDVTFTKKPSAIAYINQVATAKENEINANTTATAQEKEAAIQNVKEQLEIAEININNGVTKYDVNEAVEIGENAINDINPDVVTRPNAINSIDNLATQLKETFANTPGATVDELNEANQQVDQIVQSAKTEIANATSDIDIAQLKANAMNDLNAVVVNVEQKAIAANALKEQADKVQDMIDSNDDATETEKLAAEEQLNDILEQGLTDIDAKDTNNDIAKVKENALEQLKAINVVAVVKPEARTTIANLVQKQIDKINQTPKATKEEKEAAIEQLNPIEQNAIELIKATPSDSEVKAIVKDAEQQISQIEAQASIKDDIEKEINKHITLQKEKINNADVSQRQKDKALNQLDRLASLIADQLEAADTNEAVMKVKEEAIEQIEAILPETEQQSPKKSGVDFVPNKKANGNDEGNDDSETTRELTKVESEETIEADSEVDKQDRSETLPETGKQDNELPLAGITFAAGAALVSRRMVQKKDKLK
uniref:DUF1542 domain-containing protein n=1 Tax=Staphylococcus warneri TaxID=1292 RepID=UPI001C3ECC83|nr:DUF1542 domain-containing protein [Staphylococcus warneri]